MRISDWSSYVCSSDLKDAVVARVAEGQPVDPDLDADPRFAVAQGFEPCGEGVGIPDLDHGGMLTTVYELSTVVHYHQDASLHKWGIFSGPKIRRAAHSDALPGPTQRNRHATGTVYTTPILKD